MHNYRNQSLNVRADFVIPPDTFRLIKVAFFSTNYIYLQYLGAFL